MPNKETSPNPETRRLPNGWDVRELNRHETDFLYKEIVERDIYFQHGIELASGDTVFDVGANIGLFAIRANAQASPLQFHLFEPSPQLAPILRANLSQFCLQATVHACGLGRDNGEMAFTFYPGYSLMSGFYADPARDRETLRAGIAAEFAEEDTPQSVRDRFIDATVETALEETVTAACPVRTLSVVLREENIERVDLLKLDVEGGEHDVLAGLEAPDWIRIRQVAAELHATDEGEAESVVHRFEREGFQVTFEHDAATGLGMLYAHRSGH